ncbi:protein ALP [Salix suchowensis]|nr:protein ALP [Salix suchowensis]
MSVMEKVVMFLYTIVVGASNREVQERFQHSGETISRCIKEVLEVVCLFTGDVIKPTDSQFFTNTLREIAMNQRYMLHFKNCVGAIDGTHDRVCISTENQVLFIRRKGWEGSAHDTRIFLEAINNNNIKFPKPLEGRHL